MQNPFRHQDEPGRQDRERDDNRWRSEDRRPDEYRTWGGGDGGRSAEAFRREEQSYGRQSGPAGAWTQDAYQQNRGQGAWSGGYSGPGAYATGAQSYSGGPQFGQDYGQQAYGSQAYGSQGYGSQAYGASGQQGYGSQSGQGYGYQTGHASGPQMSQGYGSQMGHAGSQMGYSGSQMGQGYGGQSGQYASHGYAPGAQIWQGSGQGMGGQSHEHHEFEPDYLHWRQQQLSAFDKDYSDWRSERREKFSSDFDSWRSSRPRVQAENPIVGDVSDGGTGDASEAKKR